ncbi:MAG TPA: hypothetical protein VGC27_08920 [Rhizomicrobium sp.]
MSAGAADYNKIAKEKNWVSLCDASVTFSHPDLRRLLGLWRKQAKGGIPLYRNMTSRVLKSFLTDIAICERIVGDGGERRYRICMMGVWLAQILGNFTGKFLDDVLPPEHLPRWQVALDATLADRVPLRFLGRTDTNAMSFLNGEYFTAPLLADDGSASFILAAGRFTGGRSWEEVEAEARQALGLL